MSSVSQPEEDVSVVTWACTVSLDCEHKTGRVVVSKLMGVSSVILCCWYVRVVTCVCRVILSDEHVSVKVC